MFLFRISVYCSSCYGSGFFVVVIDNVMEGCREVVVVVGLKEVFVLMLFDFVGIVIVDVVEGLS